MNKKIVLLLILVFLMAALVWEFPFRKRKIFNEDAVYTVVQIPNSCVLRILNGEDGREYWISDQSVKEVRNHIGQQLKLNAEWIFADAPTNKEHQHMGVSDNCDTGEQNPQIFLKILEIVYVYD
jgi:hypothetical protein